MEINYDLILGIAFGGIFGALLASTVQGEWIRWIFYWLSIPYYLRLLFSPRIYGATQRNTKSNQQKEALTGTIIGIIAAFGV
nr:sulfite exporter TauE/SafE family protein [Proteus mirabilis]